MSYRITADLARALRLPDKCTHATLTLTPLTAPTIECRYIVSVDAAGELITAVSKYTITFSPGMRQWPWPKSCS
jgi:hypothetical protein